jgi:UDP-glucose:(heptosyl)LPS alpha-1,3-glucosyltransferase
MDIALCYESVLPDRGGCERYIAALARRLVADGHTVHLYACRWDADVLPSATEYHLLRAPRGPRFLRPWLFGAACERALRSAHHDLSIGFNKTWGQDILYPQGGLHVASAECNLRKHRRPLARRLGRWVKRFDPAHWSFSRLERRQYLGAKRSLVVVNSHMVRRHFERFYNFSPNDVRVIHSAIDSADFREEDRPRQRFEWRQRWGIGPEETVALFIAMNYRLKGLVPLLEAVRLLPRDKPFRLLVVGDPSTNTFERQARRLGIVDRVCFAGYFSNTRHCYFAADFFVHPTFYDPCSLVVLEALACGLPVITSRFNGASEFLTPPNEGYVIDDPHDVEQLADCLVKLLDHSRRLACAHAARRKAELWTFDHHYDQLLQVFAEAAAQKRAA